MHPYIVKAYNKMNSKLISIERDSRGKAINTARYWVTRGAEYAIVETCEFEKVAWIDKNGTEYYD